jgi:hypothetical protein
MAADRMDERVFGPYCGTPPERRTDPELPLHSEPPLAPPEPLTRAERMTRFLNRRRRQPFVDRGFTP